MFDQPVGIRVVGVAASTNVVLAISAAGQLFSHGASDNSVHGHGAQVEVQPIPRVIEALHGIRICAVACSGIHSLAVSASGALFSFGKNFHGQLGLGELPRDFVQDAPRRVEGLALHTVKKVAAGNALSLALTTAGDVFSFGEASRAGHGGNGDEVLPRQIASLQRVTTVACAGAHCLALTYSGDVMAWGSNEHGQLGLGDTSERSLPNVVPLGARAVSVAAGNWHSLAVTEEGAVFTWGKLWTPQPVLWHPTPQPVSFPRGVHVCRVEAGHTQSFAIDCQGHLFGWNSGDLKLGIAPLSADRSRPEMYTGLLVRRA